MKRCSIFLLALIFGSGMLLAVTPALAQPFDEAGNDLSLGLQPLAPVSPEVSATPPAPPDGCFDDNLQTLAVATSSGGGSGSRGPEQANDGVLGYPDSCNMHWITTQDYANGEWFELTWPNPVDICQIFVDTKDYLGGCGFNTNRILSNATIQWWDGAAWVTQATVSGQTDDWSYVFPGGITTDRLRLFDVFVDNALGFQAGTPVLFELKVYGGTPIPQTTIPTLSEVGIVVTLLLLGAAGVFFGSRKRMAR